VLSAATAALAACSQREAPATDSVTEAKAFEAGA
jgi:hypothetical protein